MIQNPQAPQDMSLTEMAANTRLRVQFALGDYLNYQFPDGQLIDSDTILIEVLDWARLEERKVGDSPYRYKNKIRRKVRPNRAILTNRAIFEVTLPLKAKLKEQFLSRQLIPDERTLNIWFLEHLIHLALDHHWHWVAAVIFRILFLYEWREVQMAAEFFDYDESFPDDPNFRRIRLNVFHKLAKWFDGLTEIAETKSSNEEKQFKRLPHSPQNIAFTEEALGVIRPVKPLCAIHNKYEVDSESELERFEAWLEKLNRLNAARSAKSYDESEREIMLLLTCPNCLFDTFRALSYRYSKKKLFHNWHERLGFPAYIVPTRGGQGASPMSGDGEHTKPLEQRHLDPPEAVEKVDIKKEMRRRDDRRRNLSPEFVLIIVDGGPPLKFWLDEPKSRPLTLREGDCVIEVRGVDGEGSLLLDLHRISWDPELEDEQEYVFVTELREGRRLEFKLKYDRDEETGDLTSAAGEIVYSNPHARSSPVRKRAAGSLASVFAVVASLFALSCGVISIAYLQKSPGIDEIPVQSIASETTIKSNKQARVKPLPMPAPSPAPSPATVAQQHEGSQDIQGRDERGGGLSKSQQMPRDVQNEIPGAIKEDGGSKRRVKGSSSTWLGVAPSTADSAQRAGKRDGAQRRPRRAEVVGPVMPETPAREWSDLVQVTLNTTISSYSARDGQKFFTTVTGPNIRAPKGTVIKGEVSQVTKAPEGGGVGALRIRFIEMRLPNSQSWHKINGNLVMQPSSPGDMQSAASSRSRARREMIIVGDKKENFRLVPKDELPATTSALKRETMLIVRSRIKHERVEALVPVGEKLYISLEVNDSPSVGAAGGEVK